MMAAIPNNTESGGSRGIGLVEIVAYTRSQTADLPDEARKIRCAGKLEPKAPVFA